MKRAKKTDIKKLSKRQLDIIDDLFKGNSKESEVIKKHKVSRGVYRKWLVDDNFIDELAFRVKSARRQSEMTLANSAPKAADKLVELMNSEKEETSRKACLDVITQPVTLNLPKAKNESVRENISTEAAGRLLAVLAKEDRKE